ncbi:2-oxoglutarate dehydrogenase [Fusarium oxysporum f. sp. cepae]|uniref:2-oxoglutarate dehydrogenase, mitochondrial n=1 Tax=Fusarium oxysporum f. sp. cepae TaxID=396571 RepID=A0A3L6NAJ2_FUSOX|nr:2-oxoglutarate dehydrogenase [Fusarium oxysporum f. sp. cepae]RKK36241.1 2-oxoglutarate dehydrogenase [Fusarium oxysporum f. sp. cepae]RKK38525.1 2-oxoglutarate dehydrogenase [Fusarium oxysporum f. sp. cepae]
MLYALRTLVAREALKFRYRRTTSVGYSLSIVRSGACSCVQLKNLPCAQRTFASAAEALARGESHIAQHQFQDIPLMTRSSDLDKDSQPSISDSFLQGGAANYIDEMFRSWKQDPKSVHVSWRTYFRNMEDRSRPASEAFQPPPGLVSSRQPLATPGLDSGQTAEVLLHLKVQHLVRAYQSRGHYHAKTDPLGERVNALHVGPNQSGLARAVELEPSYYDFTEKDMDRHFNLGPGILPRYATEGRKSMNLRDIIAACEQRYCGSYGVEYLHIPDRAKCDWLRDRLEIPNPAKFSREEKRRILDGLIWGTSFERFLAAKFPNEKRFGLDGSEGLVPGVMSMIDHSADVHGVQDITIGSCHRGRLTMLGTVYGKAPEAIFAEFAGRVRSDMLRNMAGDVKYHLGHQGQRVSPDGHTVDISVLANPSHLEAVDPVATGRAFATQRLNNDPKKKRNMCVTLHGDAAIAGQGVVYETLGLSRLPAYDVGGTIRLVVNNQVGFTADVHCSRSTPYASDIAKVVDAPIFHVNADDVESVVFLCKLAADWRATFHSDCVVDIICYRKFGHNEFDQPSFTQPLMYQKVAAQTPSLDKYVQKLVSEGSFTVEEIDCLRKSVWNRLNEMYDSSKGFVSSREAFTAPWQSLKSPESLKNEVLPPVTTAIDEAIVEQVAAKALSVPSGFQLHSNLERILTGRKKALDNGTVDWSTAEALAFGTLCLEKHPVRLTGQDVQRGTFSQRHAVLHDQETGESWAPLNNLAVEQAPFEVENSPLSEFGALGFEYGVTLADPHSLVMWEAQFGDFANNTQVIIDNFIASGETKWLDRSGLVLSLPHGYDGQGAEHSSARIERFLMLCSEEGRIYPSEPERAHQDANMGLVYMTTPANYFHVLRRQMRREYRKPLVIFFSKSLLRHPLTRSDIADFTGSSTFQPVITDPEHGQAIEDPESIQRVIICSGQVYAAIQKHREAVGIKDVAITRIEELHPFPWAEVKSNLNQYKNAKTIVWAQEEHYNGGAWHYIRDRLDAVLNETEHLARRRVLFAGRGTSASPATGLKHVHYAEEKALLYDVFNVQN